MTGRSSESGGGIVAVEDGERERVCGRERLPAGVGVVEGDRARKVLKSDGEAATRDTSPGRSHGSI